MNFMGTCLIFRSVFCLERFYGVIYKIMINFVSFIVLDYGAFDIELSRISIIQFLKIIKNFPIQVQKIRGCSFWKTRWTLIDKINHQCFSICDFYNNTRQLFLWLPKTMWINTMGQSNL